MIYALFLGNKNLVFNFAEIHSEFIFTKSKV